MSKCKDDQDAQRFRAPRDHVSGSSDTVGTAKVAIWDPIPRWTTRLCFIARSRESCGEKWLSSEMRRYAESPRTNLAGGKREPAWMNPSRWGR